MNSVAIPPRPVSDPREFTIVGAGGLRAGDMVTMTLHKDGPNTYEYGTASDDGIYTVTWASDDRFTVAAKTVNPNLPRHRSRTSNRAYWPEKAR